MPAAQSLVGKVDAMYIPTDNTVVAAFEAVARVGREAKIPVFAGDTNSVGRGAIAALGFNYYEIGRQTGEIVVRILQGEKPGDIPVSIGGNLDLHVNPSSAKRMGVELSDEILSTAAEIIE